MTKEHANGNRNTDLRTKGNERGQVHVRERKALGPVRAVIVWIMQAWLHPPDREARWEQR